MRINSKLSFLLILPVLFISQDAMADGYYKNPRMNYKDECPNDIVIPCFSDTYIHDGLYFGGGVGYDSYKSGQDIEAFDVNGNFIQANIPVGARGYLGSLILGYDRIFNWFYIGLEGFAKYSSAHSPYSIDAYDADFTIRSSYGFSLMPGFKLTNMSVLYGRVGYIKTFINSDENGLRVRNLDASEWMQGIDWGLGIETAVYNRFSIRGEFTYTCYRAFKTVTNTHFNPSNTQFTLNLIYHWC